MTNSALLMLIMTCGITTIIMFYLFWKVLTIPTRTQTAKREQWQSRIGLILAMAGNAVGLGNFLRFPVQAVQNGGGAFMIPYLVCFFLMGIPLLLVEWASGKYGGKFKQHNPPFIFDKLGNSPAWKYIGTFGLFTTMIVASYYIYIESWALSYVFYSILGVFQNMNQTQITQFFNDYIALKNNIPIISWLFCLLLHLYFLSRGVGGGIEKVARIGMPLLCFLE